MAVELNHTIVPAANGESSARWCATILGLPEPVRFGHFWQVRTHNGVDLDFDSYGEGDGLFASGHYAFLVDEEAFDAIHGRILEWGVPHWADPGRVHAGEINRHDDGRGVYFASDDDHLFEIITKPYGG